MLPWWSLVVTFIGAFTLGQIIGNIEGRTGRGSFILGAILAVLAVLGLT